MQPRGDGLVTITRRAQASASALARAQRRGVADAKIRFPAPADDAPARSSVAARSCRPPRATRPEPIHRSRSARRPAARPDAPAPGRAPPRSGAENHRRDRASASASPSAQPPDDAAVIDETAGRSRQIRRARRTPGFSSQGRLVPGACEMRFGNGDADRRELAAVAAEAARSRGGSRARRTHAWSGIRSWC